MFVFSSAKPASQRRVDAREHAVEPSSARHPPEALRDERVDGHREPVKSGVTERPGEPREAGGVGREREVLHPERGDEGDVLGARVDAGAARPR